MSLSQMPSFPAFVRTSHSNLLINQPSNLYEFLPSTWDLLECFEYYFKQKELWWTKSLEYEYKFLLEKTDESNCPETSDLPHETDIHLEEIEEDKEEEEDKDEIEVVNEEDKNTLDEDVCALEL